MKSFSQLIMESDSDIEQEIRNKMKLDPKEYNYYYKGKWIIDTKHMLDRVGDRGAYDEAKKLFERAIEWLLKHKSAKGEYLFVSKSMHIAMVIDHRPDRKGRVKGNVLAIETWLGDVRKLPKPKTVQTVYAKEGTEKVIVESLGITIDAEITFIELE